MTQGIQNIKPALLRPPTKPAGCVFARFGWSQAQIDRLNTSMKAILSRFNYLTNHGTPLEIAYSTHRLPASAAPVNISDGNGIGIIMIYVRPGPKEVLSKAPVLLCQELANIYFAEYANPQSLTLSLEKSLLDNMTTIKNGLENFITSPVAQGRVILDEETYVTLRPDSSYLLDRIVFLVKHYGIEMIKHKLAFSLLPQDISPSIEIGRVLQAATKNLSKVFVQADEISSETFVAYMAMLATLAKYKDSAHQEQCEQLILTDAMGQAAIMEFIEILGEPERVKFLARFQQQPHFTSSQLKQGLDGFKILFEIFQQVFESIYENHFIINLDPPAVLAQRSPL